jgi:hypothetical protein
MTDPDLWLAAQAVWRLLAMGGGAIVLGRIVGNYVAGHLLARDLHAGSWHRNAVGAVLPVFHLALAFFLLAFVAAQTGLLAGMIRSSPGLVLRTTVALTLSGILAGLRVMRRAWFVEPGTAGKRLVWTFVGSGAFLLTFAFGAALSVPVAFFLPRESVVEDDVVMQTSLVTCVPAALASVARHHGFPLTERQVAAACDTTVIGSFLWEVLPGIRRAGFPQASMHEGTADDLFQEGLPFLASEMTPMGSTVMHAMAVLSWDDQNALIADPLLGRRTMPRTAFSARSFAFFVRLGPPDVAVWTAQP